MKLKEDQFREDENVEPEFLSWWKEKDFSGYPWTRCEVQLIALLAWRDSKHDLIGCLKDCESFIGACRYASQDGLPALVRDATKLHAQLAKELSGEKET